MPTAFDDLRIVQDGAIPAAGIRLVGVTMAAVEPGRASTVLRRDPAPGRRIMGR